MRFFMSLFSSSEKAQLGASSDGTFNKTFIKIVPNQTASDRQRQAFGGYQCMLRLGLGLGGLFNLACAPVLASSPVIRSQSWVSTATVRYPEGMNRGNNANALTPISVLFARVNDTAAYANANDNQHRTSPIEQS